MHATQRESQILDLLGRAGFITFRELDQQLSASAATLRRDLGRLASQGRVKRVRGGVMLPQAEQPTAPDRGDHLSGVPFHENIHLMSKEKEAIGRTAASLCDSGAAVMIDGGSTTLQMCPHLQGLNLQVFTNSLHIVSALLPQTNTRVLVPGGSVFREQNIILSVDGDDAMPRFHAPKLFMGAAAIGPQGVMQADIILVAMERRLIARAEQLIILVDHSKFRSSSGNVVCGLENVDLVITDAGANQEDLAMLRDAGIEVIVAEMEAT